MHTSDSESEFTHEDYVLKVVGLKDFIVGPYPFHSFNHIIECRKQRITIELAFVPLSSIPENGKEDAPDERFSLEDKYLAPDPTISYNHEEISFTNNEWDDMECLSVWDLNRFFRFRIVGIDNISPMINNFAAMNNGKVVNSELSNTYMYMTAGLYNGGELLDELYTTVSIFTFFNVRNNLLVLLQTQGGMNGQIQIFKCVIFLEQLESVLLYGLVRELL